MSSRQWGWRNTSRQSQRMKQTRQEQVSLPLTKWNWKSKTNQPALMDIIEVRGTAFVVSFRSAPDAYGLHQSNISPVSSNWIYQRKRKMFSLLSRGDHAYDGNPLLCSASAVNQSKVKGRIGRVQTIFRPVCSAAMAAFCSANFCSYQLFMPSFATPWALKTASLATSIWSVIASFLKEDNIIATERTTNVFALHVTRRWIE